MVANTFQSLINIDRFKAISDGVIAVAITILILDLKLPPNLHIHTSYQLWQVIKMQDYNVLAYLISFWMIAKNWVAHYKTFDGIENINSTLVQINILFLLSITFIPFPVSIMAKFNLSLATVLFNTALVLPAILLIIINIYLSNNTETFFADLKTAKSKKEKKIFFQANLNLIIPIIIVSTISSIIAIINNSLGEYAWFLMFLAPKITRFVDEKRTNKISAKEKATNK